MLQSACVSPAVPSHLLSGMAHVEPDLGKLWLRSDLAEIARYMRIPATPQLLASSELFQHRRIKVGQSIFYEGDACNDIYLINSGFTKSLIWDQFGNEQVVNFQMKGDILGADGIHTGRHNSGAVALAQCDVIVLPIKKLEVMSKTCRQFDSALLNLLSIELVFQQHRMCLLAASNSLVRVANFLLNLSARFFELGYSRSVFNLRMTRQELGSYLGLSLETVSRSLSLLNESGLIEVNHRGIVICDELGLGNLSASKKCLMK